MDGDELQLIEPPPNPGEVITARQRAGHSQAQAAALVGLGSVMRWSEYERGLRTPDAARWSLYLLATGQHPGAIATPRRRGNTAAKATSAAVEKSR
jgi:hypothetical protein